MADEKRPTRGTGDDLELEDIEADVMESAAEHVKGGGVRSRPTITIPQTVGMTLPPTGMPPTPPAQQ
jgi:hypothetical protein